MGETYGMNIQYLGENAFDYDSCAHYGSGNFQKYTQAYLDSCGIIIFADKLPKSPPPTWSVEWELAWVIGHELGHALGLTQHWLHGVMDVPDLDDLQNPPLRANYMKFDSKEWKPNGRLSGEWDGLEHGDAMDTRWMLGIQTIDIKHYK